MTKTQLNISIPKNLREKVSIVSLALGIKPSEYMCMLAEQDIQKRDFSQLMDVISKKWKKEKGD